ncbi:Camphor resistance CrcB protein [Methanoregula boonei 6A8]|jgi:CrcB protein|uniref:Fluoride-specific ion channel FluC n=1 Tax=Methanoregula boonei (strain DSM 21154 / JCM 14090 / 6A8) TaxID=456442 RepID=A7I6T7_METB6|nr:CrcB family protein [Methanoregula boonei]ABS55448.1 Camphor resistance CrcB protein [Methanoregula boonei 6A8]
MEPIILVGIGGATGSVLRFVLSRIQPLRGIPAGTLLVNITGSFALSLLTFSQVSGDLYYLICTGGLGGFTTFSTFSYETFRMMEDHDYRTLLTYTAVSIGGGLLAVTAGYLACGGWAAL